MQAMNTVGFHEFIKPSRKWAKLNLNQVSNSDLCLSSPFTIDSGIDAGRGINLGQGKFDKNIKHTGWAICLNDLWRLP